MTTPEDKDATSVGGATLQPLTNALITAVLDGDELEYFTDSDDDVGASWQEFLLYFFRSGDAKEILYVRATIERQFKESDLGRLYEFCNEWNDTKLWPKAFVRVNKDGDDSTVLVVGEVSTDLEFGVTFEQLRQLMRCAISTSGQLAAAVQAL
jgi:hypothetical protein